MAELETRINELERRQTGFEVRFDMYMQKTDELIRLQREQIQKIDEKLDNMNRDLGNKIDSLAKFVQSMAVTAMIGMLGIAGSVVYFVYSVTPKP